MTAQIDVGGDRGVLRSMWYFDHGGSNSMVVDIDSHISHLVFLRYEIL